MKTLALRTATALILVGLAAAAPKAQAALLPVVDPGFEYNGKAASPGIDTEDANRGWFEAVGGAFYAEYENTETNSNVPEDAGTGVVWGALGTDGGGRLYQNIGTVELVTYTVSGNLGRLSNQPFNQIHIELWATDAPFTGANGTDPGATGTLLDSATLAELALFGNEDAALATAPFSVDLTATGNAGDDLWVALAGTDSAGAAAVGTPGGENPADLQLIDDINVSIIPEPASFLLLLIGSVAVVGRRRRRRA